MISTRPGTSSGTNPTATRPTPTGSRLFKTEEALRPSAACFLKVAAASNTAPVSQPQSIHAVNESFVVTERKATSAASQHATPTPSTKPTAARWTRLEQRAHDQREEDGVENRIEDPDEPGERGHGGVGGGRGDPKAPCDKEADCEYRSHVDEAIEVDPPVTTAAEEDQEQAGRQEGIGGQPREVGERDVRRAAAPPVPPRRWSRRSSRT